MMRALWTAKTGMDAMQSNLDVISNNLANVNTNGFKATRPIFQDLLYQTVSQPGAATSTQTQLPVGLQFGTGVMMAATERIFSQGSPQPTGNNFDAAIDGQGFFQVVMPDGTTAYTRDGDFQINALGQLVTPQGYPITPTITIPSGAQQFNISPDGIVTAQLPGQTTTTQIATIQLANFINPTGLLPIGNNLYQETLSSGTPTVGTPGLNGMGTLAGGYVEASNVNITEELINMIQAQRAYEINSRTITTADAMLQKLEQM